MIDIARLEKKRISKLQKIVSYAALLMLLITCAGVLAMLVSSDALSLLFVVLTVAGMIFVIANRISRGKISKLFTSFIDPVEENAIYQTVLQQMWGNNIAYYPEKGYSLDEVCHTNLFSRFNELDLAPYLLFSSSDLVLGSWNGIDFQIADIVATYSSSTTTLYRNDHIKITSRQTNGTERIITEKYILIKADFPFDFDGQTWVLPKNKTHFIQTGELVNLESSEFDGLFTVYSNNQMGARMALQTDIMVALIELKQVLNQTPHVAFINNQVWIALPVQHNWLYLTIFGNVSKQIEQTQIQLQKISQILLKLKLNSMGNRVD